jgi:hypothetical protein
MKKLLLGSIVIAVLSLAGLGRAYAQDATVVKVPFPFVAGETLLPAGDYRVSPAMPDGSVLAITSMNGSASATVAVNPGDPAVPGGEPAFVFHAFGKRYFLAEVRTTDAPAYSVRLAPKDVDRVLAKLNLADYRGEAVHQH